MCVCVCVFVCVCVCGAWFEYCTCYVRAVHVVSLWYVCVRGRGTGNGDKVCIGNIAPYKLLYR